MRVLEEVDDEPGESLAAFLDRAVDDAGDEHVRVEGQVDDFAEEAVFGAEEVDDQRGVNSGFGGD